MRSADLLARGSLVLLLGIELLTRYDTFGRQVALAITNLATLVGLTVAARVLARRGIALPASVGIVLALAVWFDAAGNFAHLYAEFWWYDKLAHSVGSAAVTLAVAALVRLAVARGTIVLPRWMQALFAASIAAMLASVYEVTEYLGDLWFATHRVTDFYDTVDDLLWNSLAIAVAVLAFSWLTRRADHGSTASRP